MSELDEQSILMIALGGWMAGVGIATIMIAAQEKPVTSPYLSGSALGILGAIIILSEIYLARQQE